MTIEKAEIKDLDRIVKLAKLTWFETYKEILSTEQSNFMFHKMYDKDILIENYNSGNEFYIISQNKDLGYMELIINNDNIKISKIYVLTGNQRKGIGKELINKAVNIGQSYNSNKITLNVNRNNSAKLFYLKNNFTIIKEVDIEIGNGYLMEDYLMERLI
jgi:diamine N-acetyltransferase